jgi:plastocyanin
MRKLITGLAVAATVLTPALLVGPGAFASTAAKAKPPVKLPGKVTVKGSATATGGTIEVDQTDFAFSPTFVKVPAGTTSLTVTVKNMGQAMHTFTVPSQSIDKVLNPGDSVTVTVAYPGKGALLFYCRFHRSRGMQGAFYDKNGAKLIKAGGAGATATTKPSSSGGSGGYGY